VLLVVMLLIVWSVKQWLNAHRGMPDRCTQCNTPHSLIAGISLTVEYLRLLNDL
jgi:hypothetical protein